MKRINSFFYSNLNYKIISIFFIFLFTFGITSGVYLNKVYPIENTSIIDHIIKINSYYDHSNFPISKLIVLNLKNDFFYLFSVYICSLMIFTWPLILGIIFLKGLSIGYTISILLLALKENAMKIIISILIKNILIIPFSLIIILFAFNYFMESIGTLKICSRFKNSNHMKKLIKKYTMNTIVLFIPMVLIQSMVNGIYIYIAQRIF